MMMGSVHIMSKEMVRPSVATPDHLRSYEISSLDQFAVSAYIRLLFFYRPPNPNPSPCPTGATDSDGSIVLPLKKSLSETLTHYHPIAGRFLPHENMIHCDDSGAEFTSAVVVGGDETLFQRTIDNPDMDFLEKLLPKGSSITDSDVDVILAVQVTRFHGGAISLGFCISHKISDGITICSFLKCWSAAARLIMNSNSTVDPANFKELGHLGLGAVLDAPKLWPLVPGFPLPATSSDVNQKELTCKRWVISVSDINRLRQELAGNGGSGEVPSRAKSVMALIWHAIIEANLTISTAMKTRHLLTFSANIRGKMSPAISDNVLGNAVKLVAVAYDDNNDNNDRIGIGMDPPLAKIGRLVELIKDGIEKIDGEYAKKKGPPVHDPFVRILFDTSMKRFHTVGSCWCRLPFYEADLGLGRPIWVACPKRSISDEFILMDGPNGEIEAWIWLEDDAMDKFEKNPTLLSFFNKG